MKVKEIMIQQQCRGQRGFTLVEVLMAMVILGIGLFAIAALQVNNMNYNTGSKKQTEGYTWAKDQVERILSSEYTIDDKLKYVDDDGTIREYEDKGNPVTPVAGDGHTDSRGPYTVEWDVHNNDGTNGLPNLPGSKRIHVSVRWNNKQVAQLDYTRVKASF